LNNCKYYVGQLPGDGMHVSEYGSQKFIQIYTTKCVLFTSICTKMHQSAEFHKWLRWQRLQRRFTSREQGGKFIIAIILRFFC